MPEVGIMLLKTMAFRNEPLLMLPPRRCLTIHTSCFNITNTTIGIASESLYIWTDVVNYVCYLLLPMVAFFCVLGQVVNIVILASQIRLSLDTYLLSMSIASLLQVCATIMLSLPHYIGHHDGLVYVQYYSMITREWFCHIALWLLISVSLERSVTFTLHKTYVPGTSIQAWIITAIVTCIGLISAIPRLWEYKVTTEINSSQNQNSTHILTPIVLRTSAADDAGFSVIYFWYLSSVFVILPILLMLISCVPLCYSTEKTLSSRNFSNKCSTNTAIILNRRIIEDIALTKLIMTLITLYLLLTSPLTLLHVLAGLAPDSVKMETPFTISLQNIFTVLYYIYFVIHQQIYFCYNKQYRLTLLSLCCCCC